jgi:hypothetical protein
LQRRWKLGGGYGLNAGIFAGGGGGAAAPVGDGLMIRPALTLTRDLGGGKQAGVSLSTLRFAGSPIHSTQIGVNLAWDGDFRAMDASRTGGPIAVARASGLGLDRLAATAGFVKLIGNKPMRYGLIGARAEQFDGPWRVGIEAAAAAQGGAAGYMEILPTVAYELPLHPQLLPNIHAGFRAALGLGGGGAVPTGGGVIGKVGTLLHWRGEQGWTAGVAVDLIAGTSSSFRGFGGQVWVAMPLEPRRQGWQLSTPGTVTRYEWIPTVQSELRAARKTGTASTAVTTIGLKLNRWFGDHLYATGQAHSAFAGGAGAYSIGLVGGGVATSARDRRWQAGAEVLVGAAGGGGISTAGGAIVQGLAWLGWSPRIPDALALPRRKPAEGAAEPADEPTHGQWRIGAGAMRSVNGGLRSPVVELSWRKAFGLNGI